MVAPGYRCYYARQVRLRRYDRNIVWDLTPWWDALSESAKRLYEDEEEGRIYFDAAGKARNAITLYYHHHRALAGMESTPALWRAIRLNWEMEPQDVRAYWEGLLFVGSPDVVSAQGAPTLSTSSQGFHMGTSIEPYYRKATSAAARAPTPLPSAQLVSREVCLLSIPVA